MLKISNVETFYGKIQALRGVDIDVNDGEIVSLIGSNGAGKSTLLMTISGVNKARNGNITFNGERIENREPHKIVDLGICQVPEGRRIFSRLTVEDNLRLGASVNEKGKNFDKDLNFKMSNMNMNIKILHLKDINTYSSSTWIDQRKINNYMLPTFTKKVVKYLEKN